MIKDMISRLFPSNAISIVSRSRSDDVEVNGLPQGFIPQNCEILLKGEEIHGRMLRTHYLVKSENRVVYLTMCQPEYGDSTFALIRGTAQAESEDGADVCRRAISTISRVCQSTEPMAA